MHPFLQGRNRIGMNQNDSIKGKNFKNPNNGRVTVKKNCSKFEDLVINSENFMLSDVRFKI